MGVLLILKTQNIFFFEKSFTKCDGETIPRHISKKSKLSICYFFLPSSVVCQVEGYQNIIKLSSRPLVCTSYKAF